MSKKTKRAAHDQRAIDNLRGQIAPLQAKVDAMEADAATRLRGTSDEAAQLRVANDAATQYIERRRDRLAKLSDAAEKLQEFFHEAVGHAAGLKAETLATIEAFKPAPVGSYPINPVETVIAERDAAVAETAQAKDELEAAKVETSKLRLQLLDYKPCPPKWLMRLERDFEALARIPTKDVVNSVFDKAMNWARDYRLLNKKNGSEDEQDPPEEG